MEGHKVVSKFKFKGVPKSKLSMSVYEQFYKEHQIVINDILQFKRHLFSSGESGITIDEHVTKTITTKHTFIEY